MNSAFIAFGLIVFAQESHGQGDTLKAALSAPDPRERTSAYFEVITDRDHTIAQLIEILEDKEVDKCLQGPLHLAIQLAGELRANECAKYLARHLLYNPHNGRDEDGPWHIDHDAAIALWKIGLPSLGPLMQRIRWSNDDKERRLAAWTLMRIEGEESAIRRLRKLEAELYDEDVKPRLSQAANYIENFVFRERIPLRSTKGTLEFQEYQAPFESRYQGGLLEFRFHVRNVSTISGDVLAEISVLDEDGECFNLRDSANQPLEKALLKSDRFGTFRRGTFVVRVEVGGSKITRGMFRLRAFRPFEFSKTITTEHFD